MIRDMAHVTVLYGGSSEEHTISCMSAASVLKNLNPVHSIRLIGISRDGVWYLQDLPDPVPDQLQISAGCRVCAIPGGGLMLEDGRHLQTDVVLPVLHGRGGEDGSVQGLLESARLACAGSGIGASAAGMDKDTAKRLWEHAGLPVVRWQTLRSDQICAQALFDSLGTPLFVKPACSGSSMGVSKVSNTDQLRSALENAWQFGRKILVEQSIEGREIECAVMGSSTPATFPPGEIIPGNQHEFYDYNAKYTDPAGARLQVPADLDGQLTERIQELAAQAYTIVGAEGLARVDFLVEHGTGSVYINEINTMPGMTAISLFPRMTAAGGLDFRSVLEQLIADAEERFRQTESQRLLARR